jgi:Double zinc ribbon
MFRSECPICEHVNPAESRFCNACGAPLHLAPCPRCGTINGLGAQDCYKCGAALMGRSADVLAAGSSVADLIGGSDSVAPAATRESEPVAHRSSETATSARHAETDANPEDMLRELQRMMATPVSGAAATVSERVGVSSQAGSATPNNAVGPLVVASRHRPGSAVATARALPAVSSPLPRRRRYGAIVGTMVLAVLAVVGYYAYRQHLAVDRAQVPSASGETARRGGPAGGGSIVSPKSEPVRPAPIASTSGTVDTPATGSIRPVSPDPARSVAAIREDDAVAGDARRGRSDTKKASPGDGAGPAKLPSAAATRGTENQQRTGRGPERSPEAAAAAAVLVPRSPTPGAGTRIEPPPPRLGPCTEAVAALGLCAPEPTQRRE